MNQENNNLDDFLSKKLNDFEGPSDGWDTLSRTPWENAQNNFPNHKKKPKVNPLLLLSLLLGAGLLLTSIYTACLYKQNKELKANVDIVNNNLEIKDEALLVLNEDLKICEAKQTIIAEQLIEQTQSLEGQGNSNRSNITTDHKTTLAQSLNAQEYKGRLNNQLNKVLRPDNQSEPIEISVNTKGGQDRLLIEEQQETIQDQLATIEGLTQENKELKASLNEMKLTEGIATENIKIGDITTGNGKGINAKGESIDTETEGFAKLLKPIELKFLDLPSLESPKSNPLKFPPLKREYPKFEIGYNHSFTNFRLPQMHTIEQLGIVPSNNVFKQMLSIPGYSVGYALSPKLFVRTAYRHKNFEAESLGQMGIVYDKSTEYQNTDGSASNDLEMRSNTSISNYRQNLRMDIEHDVELQTGDLLTMNLINILHGTYQQIPLGLSYFIGDKRLKLELQGGLAWNRIVINGHEAHADYHHGTEEVALTHRHVFNLNPVSKQFLSGYLNIGGSYAITRKGYFRMAYTTEVNTFAHTWNDVVGLKNWNSGWNFGAYWRW